MASRRRLGRGLSDIDQRVSQAPRTTGGIIPTQIPSDSRVAGIIQTYPIVPGSKQAPTTPEGEIEDEEETFAPYPVDLADTYGQGPDRSTLVAGHKFVHIATATEGRLLRRAQGNLGTVYVKFQRPGRMGATYKYNRVPDTIYQMFAQSNSKGRFINDYLNKYTYEPSDGDPNASDL